jgi:hypothetical protein
MVHHLRFVGICAALFLSIHLSASAQWSSTFCPGVTITATTNSGMSPQPDCAGIFATLLPGGWDGGSASGFIRYNWSSAITSVRLEFFSVNTNDFATISTNTGGSLTVTPINGCAPVSGVVVGPYTGSGPYGTVAVNVSSTIPFTQLNFNNTGGSSGWVCDCPVNVILATDLDYLQAKYDGEGAVRLDWQTSQERSTSHFVVERSLDAVEWESVGETPAAGNSEMAVPYNLTDFLPISGKSMYRIRCINDDGSYTISAVETVLVDDYIKVFPSLSHQFVNVIGLTNPEALRMFDHLGKEYTPQATQVGDNLRLDISQLPNGMYVLRLQESNKMLSRKIWKN